jgi:integrase
MAQDLNPSYRNAKLRYYRAFVKRYPRLSDWFAAPLVERVGRVVGESFREPSHPASFRARTYLVYLGLRGYCPFDYSWLFAPEQLPIVEPAEALGIDLGARKLVEEAVALGFNPNSARQAMHWSISRIALHTGIFDVASITNDLIVEALEAIRHFADQSDLERFYPSAQQYRQGAAKNWITHLHQLQVVLYHRGQIAEEPRKLMPGWKPPLVLPPRMQAVADKWLDARRLTDRPATVGKLELTIRRFGDWLSEHHPEVVSWADVTRDHCLTWLQHLVDEPTERTGKPLGVVSRIQRASGLGQFFRDTAAWQWEDVPGRSLLGPGDSPKSPIKVPRFIPDAELDKLMPVINEIACPFQRAALLIARWSGARRDEIRRLPIDCLDRYADGTGRLRLPARKTYKERVVPLHDDAVAALDKVIDLRSNAPERPFVDELTGQPVRYLFMQHGKLLSTLLPTLSFAR